MMSALLLIAPLASLQSPDPHQGKKLVFNQDFRHENSIDLKQWKFNDGPVYNNEAETYTSGPGEFASVKNGALVITAKRVDKKIMSTRIESTQSWRYGYIEATVKVPPGNGTWPAFWMLNDAVRQEGAKHIAWPRCGEIDIMEVVGFDPTKAHFSLHCEKLNFMKNTQRTVIADLPNSGGYHTYGCDWKADSITFYLDGKVVKTFAKDEDTFESWPFRDKFYIIVNLAIGGNWGGAKGIDESIFPAEYSIRDIKVWQ